MSKCAHVCMPPLCLFDGHFVIVNFFQVCECLSRCVCLCDTGVCTVKEREGGEEEGKKRRVCVCVCVSVIEKIPP